LALVALEAVEEPMVLMVLLLSFLLQQLEVAEVELPVL
jgi:hypothetical protein